MRSIKERLKAAQHHQKNYVDKRHRLLVFEVGDRVFLKISPWKGLTQFGMKEKLKRWYIKSFEILQRVGKAAC